MSLSNDPIEIALALKTLILNDMPDVIDNGVGRNVVRQTPAMQIIPRDGDLRTLAAGGGIMLVDAQYEVVFYRIYNPNKLDDEVELGSLLSRVIAIFEDRSKDFTLGGLVETTRLTSYEFGEFAQQINNTAFKVLAIYVGAGEPSGSGGF